MTLRPYRSVLYIPGSRARALDKARTMPVDSIIFDLEDAVALEEKASARAVLVAHLLEGGYGSRSQIIRINGLDTPWAARTSRRLPKSDPRRCYCPRLIMPR
jgi:(3S)-malyl-CoA thioesterase